MKIGIVNDTPMALHAIIMALREDRQYHVIWTAVDGAEAVSCCMKETPDLVLMDLVMPKMDGIQATQKIMQTCPTAILVITASIDKNCAMAFRAMNVGALDVIATPVLGKPEGVSILLNKIAQLETLIQYKGDIKKTTHRQALPISSDGVGAPPKLVAIGCSAGGPAALAELLKNLPLHPQTSIVIIQHIDQSFCQNLVDWLKTQTKSPLRLAVAGERPEAGTIVVANSAEHLELFPSGKFGYTNQDPKCTCTPSVDLFFLSVARHWKGKALGVILTGMGRDGAQGLLEMKKKGFPTIAQDQESSTIFGMPKAAIKNKAASKILSLQKIAEYLSNWITNREKIS